MAKVQNIYVYKGEEVDLVFTMDPVEDITGWTILFTVRKSLKSGSLTMSKTATISDASGGQFVISIDADDTEELRAGDYLYDTTRTDAENETVLSTGVLSIKPTARIP